MTDPDTYGQHLSKEDTAKRVVAAELREVDPCGFFDKTVLQTHGQLVTLGPAQFMATCEAGIVTAASQAENSIPSSIFLELTDSGPAYSDADKKKDVNGVAVYDETDMDDACKFTVTLAVPDGSGNSDDSGGNTYMRIVTQGFGAKDHNAANCVAANETVNSVITHSRDKKLPRRTDSSSVVPLATTDPCSLIPHLPQGFTVADGDWDMHSGAAPYYCLFHFLRPGASTSKYADAITVSYSLTEEYLVNYGDVHEQINGHPVKVQHLGSSICAVDFPVGNTIDANLPGSNLSDSVKRFSRNKVVVTIHTPCDVYKEVASSAMSQFGG
ncbi:hypothetical protein ACQP1G_17290 [Nocardia sp. CA-107356]|uniref:hypothetical protein n=1 Tax=Nocardia sp. CA-107356 TaxID=3239972 RepID=UPI003D8D2958